MRSVAVVLSGLVAVATAQLSGWTDGQNSTTMCYWQQLRGSTVRDVLYLDGGSMYWKPTMANGSSTELVQDENPQGYMLSLNFSNAFSTAQNVTSLFGEIAKAGEGSGTSGAAPDYYDGAMLTNDAQLYLYGGLLQQTDTHTEPDANEGFYYELYEYGTAHSFSVNMGDYQLPSGLTRYLAYGGAAMAPSENKAWYFSGMHSPVWGPIYQTTSNKSDQPSVVSDTLITLDMTNQIAVEWFNDTLPATVKGRASPELVWVPVGEQGVLVAIGGVVYPEFADGSTHVSSNATASEEESPVFMTTMDVYDISNATWYKQNTTGGGPGMLARACTVMAAAADRSSFNIYSYGGYDGLNVDGDYNDDVWVLSLPSFTWTRVYTGNTSHARAGHRCVLPYPDQMFVVGGVASMASSEPCVEGMIQVFNLSSAEWLDAYSPELWSNYSVPDAVVEVIGGDGQGGATATQPASGNWETAALGAVFSTSYTTAIATYYPYPLAEATTTDSANTTSSSSTATAHSGSKVPSFLPPLLGVICGLMFVSLCVLGFVLYRRRALLRNSQSGAGGRRSSRGIDGSGPGSVTTYDTQGNRIRTWMLGIGGIGSIKRSPSMTTTSVPDGGASPTSPDMGQVSSSARLGGVYGTSDGTRSQVAEMPNSFIAEMLGDTEHPSGELSSVPDKSSVSSPTRERAVLFASSTAELASETGLRHARKGSKGSAGVTARPDSPSLGNGSFSTPTPPTPSSAPTPSTPSTDGPLPSPARRRHRESGISELSEADRVHLRQGSEGGESVTSNISSVVSPSTPQEAPALPLSVAAGRPHPIPEAAAAEEAAEAEGLADMQSPQPPSAPGLQPPSAPPSPSSPRRSVFRESKKDLSE